MVLDDAALIGEIVGSGLFEPAWYLAHNADVAAAALDPATHFARFGMREGRMPNPYFDLAWYARENPDITAAGLEPFLHYLRHGDHEGRRPHPLFDPVWYRQSYDLPEEVHALRDFLGQRIDGDRAPCAELAAVLLLPAWDGQRRIDRFLQEQERLGLPGSPDPGIVAESGLLDPNHYLINASDVHESGLDPVDHYCRFGWRENRQPNVYFAPEWYIATNPDLDHRRMNPIVHYVLVGEPAGRRPVPYFDPVWYRQAYDVPPGQTALAHYLVHRRRQIVSPNGLFDVGWYVERFAEVMGPNRDPFAHYLQAGTLADIDPSRGFNAAEYRRRHLGRASRGFRRMMRPDVHNPLVHYLRATYR